MCEGCKGFGKVNTLKSDFTICFLIRNSYFVDEISMPSTFEQLRTTSAGYKIRTLVDYLALNVTNPALINALLLVKYTVPCAGFTNKM